MERSVKELDVLAVFDNRLRNPQMLPKAARDALGDRRLAIARGAVQEKPGAGVDRWAQQFHRLRLDHHVRKRLLEVAATHHFGANRLGVDRDHVVVQRHRRGANVRTSLRGGPGAVCAQVGERVIIIA